MKKIIPLITLLALCAAVLGQSKPGSIDKHTWSKYDKVKDRTEVGSKPVVLNGGFSHAMTGVIVGLVAYCTFPATELKASLKIFNLPLCADRKGCSSIGARQTRYNNFHSVSYNS